MSNETQYPVKGETLTPPADGVSMAWRIAQAGRRTAGTGV